MLTLAQGLPPDLLVGIACGGEDVHPQGERRKSLRLRLQWSVYVTRNGGTHPLRSKTRDLSSHGFYCVLPERLTAGEHIECDLVIPTHVSRSADDVLFLRCQARVVRVETRDPGEGHGLACQIEDYCLIPKTTREDPPPSPWNGTKLV